MQGCHSRIFSFNFYENQRITQTIIKVGKMEILKRDKNGEGDVYIDVNGTAIDLARSPADNLYRGALKPDRKLPVNELIGAFIAKTTSLLAAVLVDELSVILRPTGELNLLEIKFKKNDAFFGFSDLFSSFGIGVKSPLLPSLKIGIKELQIDDLQNRISILGNVETRGATAEIDIDFIRLSDEDIDLSFSYTSESKDCITIGDLIQSAIPESFAAILPAPEDTASHNRLYKSLTESGLTDLQFNANTLVEEISFVGKGTLIGLKGEIAFSIMNVVDRRMVSFHILLTTWAGTALFISLRENGRSGSSASRRRGESPASMSMSSRMPSRHSTSRRLSSR